MDILLVEDDKIIASGLEYALSQEGYSVTSRADVSSASEAIAQTSFSLAILDLSLPDGTGFELCEALRRTGNIPIIFLTAADDEGNAVKALEMGADDYVTKPFRLRELLARIKSILRRTAGSADSSVIHLCGSVSVNTQKAKVYKNGEEITLTALEYRLLLTFASNEGQVLTRGLLLEGIWDVAGSFVNDNTLTVYIKRLREKLGDDMQNPQIIQTVRGLGYRTGK